MSVEEFSDQFDVLLNSSFIANEFGEQSSKIDIQLDEYEKSVFLTQAQEQLVINLYNGRNIEGLSFESAEESRRYLKDLTERETFKAIKNNDGPYSNCYYIYEIFTTLNTNNFETSFKNNNTTLSLDSFKDGVYNYKNIVFPVSLLKNGTEYTVTHLGNALVYPSDDSKIRNIYIPDNITNVSASAINLSHVTKYKINVFCESNSKPTNWESDWYYPSNLANVYWGKTLEDAIKANQVTSINNCLFITKETAILKDQNLPQWVNEIDGIKQLSLEVTPITQDEYHRFRRNPYKTFNEFRVLRIEDNNQLQLFSKYNVDTYFVDYIRKPKPIIVSDLGGLSIDGETEIQTSELNPILHRTILLEAVKLAKIVKQNQIRNEMLGNMPGQLVHPPMQPVNQRPN